jgi:transcriptional regulator with XRE-family HTH domain
LLIGMGHRPVSRVSTAFGEFVADERRRRSLTRAEVAGLVRKADRSLTTNEQALMRWEIHGRIPQPAALRALAAVLDVPLEQLVGLTRGEVGRSDDTDEAAELLALIEGSDIGGGAIADMEAATLRLRRSYARMPRSQLIGQIRDRLRRSRRLLQGRLTSSQRRDLQASAGWLALLAGTSYYDVDQREPAWAYREAALGIARDLGHAELEAWAWETAAWFSLADDRYRDALSLAQAGQKVAPPSCSVLVAVHLQEARASARLKAGTQTMAAVRRAGAALEPLTEFDLADHYSFDPAKLDFFAGSAYAAAGMPELAERHLRQLIAAVGDPDGPNYWPMRLNSAHVDLGLALAQQGHADEAGAEGVLAMSGVLLHPSTVRRARELLRVLEPYGEVAGVRDFRERLAVAGGRGED